MKVTSSRPHLAHHAALPKNVSNVIASAKGVIPSVLTPAQEKLLGKHPDVAGHGTTKGLARMTYHFKNADEAKAMAKALNEGWDGIYENTNECLDDVAVTDLKIKAEGRNVVIDLPFDKNA
ncbi:MAG: hypothetical protein ACJ790_00420 [Myxococcaceae bacterium]